MAQRSSKDPGPHRSKDGESATAAESPDATIEALRKENADLKARLAAAADRIAEVESDARRDPLTGLQNRRAFSEEVGRATDMVRRYDVPTAVLFVDLDLFKQVNDDHGHTVGDQALTHVADLLSANVRRSDMVARLGGDEFAIILAHADIATARLKAQALIEAIGSTPLKMGEASIQLGASIGATEILADDQDASTILSRADRAMYAVKTARRHSSARTAWRP